MQYLQNTQLIAQMTWAMFILIFDFFMKPTIELFGVMFVIIFIDLVTGIIKSIFKKVARTSRGLRRTIVKLMQYIIPVLLLWGAGKYIPEQKKMFQTASGFVMMFIIYIEITSIFENLYEIDSESKIAKFLYRPALIILKFGIENNPVQKTANVVTNSDSNNSQLNN